MRTEHEKQIHQSMIDYVNNSKITVEVVEIYGTVSITDNDGGKVFLQGEDGYIFVAESRRLWNKFEDITMSEVHELLAYPYADLLME